MKKILAIFLSVFLFLLLVPPMLVRGQSVNPYSVSGYVFDDRNRNGVQDGGEPGISGKRIYLNDSVLGANTYSDYNGYFQLNVPGGTQSVEIAAVGAQGGMPTTAEKILVDRPRGDLRFGIQNQGYDVVGYVIDNGRPVAGAIVYLDNGTNWRAVTDQYGRYRIENVTFDASQVIPGYQGGHNVYVQGYEDTARVLVNPQQPLATFDSLDNYSRHDFNLAAGQVTPGCSSYIWVRNSSTRQCSTVCSNIGIPSGYYADSSCGQTQYPGGQQCTPNTSVGQSFSGCSGNGQLCTMTPTYGTNCQVSNVASNCQPYTPGVCGYQGGYQPYQPTYQPSYSSPSCAVSATSGNVPYNSTIHAAFNNGGNSNLYPNYYSFRIDGQGHETSTSNSSYSFSWPFNSGGSHYINLNVQYNGGSVNCSTQVNAQSLIPSYYNSLYSDQDSQAQVLPQYQSQPVNDPYSNLYSEYVQPIQDPYAWSAPTNSYTPSYTPESYVPVDQSGSNWNNSWISGDSSGNWGWDTQSSGYVQDTGSWSDQGVWLQQESGQVGDWSNLEDGGSWGEVSNSFDDFSGQMMYDDSF